MLLLKNVYVCLSQRYKYVFLSCNSYYTGQLNSPLGVVEGSTQQFRDPECRPGYRTDGLCSCWLKHEHSMARLLHNV